MKIGFLGMGVMGLPMAKNLVAKSGCEILGYDVVEKQRIALAEAGGTAVDDPMEIYNNCEIIMQILPTHAIIRDSVEKAVKFGKPGRIIVDLSSTAPDIIQELYALAKDAGMFLSAMLTAIVTAPTAEKQVSTYIETACYPPLIRRIIHYIEQTHTDSFSLDQLAKQLGYNKRYLCSAFRNATGYTILDYLNHVRIRHATNCFYYYDVPIGVIAETVGFITAVHFTRVFKKLVGISPSTFRSHYNLGNDPSESRRLTGSELSVYDEILGVKILPLDDAVQALLELGRRTGGK